MAQLLGRSGRKRRTQSEINMVPFIDVMLVLLIIFMVSAPLLPTGVIDLPTMGKAQKAPEKVVEIIVEDEDRVKLRVNQQDSGIVMLGDLARQVKEVQESAEGGAQAVPVIISARKDVRYEAVVKIMDTLQRAGIARVGLSVRTTGG
ncbi:MAG: biopolymer transporter ExbD [Aquabacterium sp.]